ncbi:hypothetical protein ILYODFUR_032238 [Ilyodon furcidens]|uniref:Uncharacterized protein n=1 Tax=Ilyodon furcidens TaxID=33524 RepID=A0ABV0UN52_9TELE
MGVYGVFTATHLQVEVILLDMFNGSNNLLNWILGGVIIFLAMFIISLVVKIRTFYTAQTGRKNVEHCQNLDSCTLNYAALRFPPKAKSNRRSAAEGEMGTNVLYAATR